MYICNPKKIQCGVEQLVARRAHNPKATGSSPVPATFDKKSPAKGSFFYFIFGILNSWKAKQNIGPASSI